MIYLLHDVSRLLNEVMALTNIYGWFRDSHFITGLDGDFFILRSDANEIGLAPREDKQRRRPSALEVPSLKRGRRLSDDCLGDPSENLLVRT